MALSTARVRSRSDKGKNIEGVPAPAAGYIKVDTRSGLVKIYDALPDGEMIAQVRHMDLHGFQLKDGDHIGYGQPMGIQAGMGSGNLHKYPTHVHIDFNAGQSERFNQYIRDIDTGVITTDKYPKVEIGKEAQVETNVASPQRDAKQSLEPDDRGVEVRHLQELLTKLGYRDAHALQADSKFGMHTVEAVLAFQKADSIEALGIAGPKTLAALHDAERSPTPLDPAHPDHALHRQASLRCIDSMRLWSGPETLIASAWRPVSRC
ncbi:MAG TPA: peptidoglycan-binding domain-containing protein [Lysobacter sp.]|jgi:hypothetical protein|nr:peptidoglycan-binding domain-containing protein [Lysobacter sp.]